MAKTRRQPKRINQREILNRINLRICKWALPRMKRKSGKTIAEDLEITKPQLHRSKVVRRLFTRYYWAPFHEAGRGEVRAKPGGPPLMFFKNPEEDPRNQPKYSKTLAQAYRRKKKLTRAKIRKARQAGRLIITRGPVQATEGTKFASTGPGGALDGIQEEAARIAQQELTAVLLGKMPFEQYSTTFYL